MHPSQSSPNFKPFLDKDAAFFPEFDCDMDEELPKGIVVESKIDLCSRSKLEEIKVKKFVKSYSVTLPVETSAEIL